MEAEVNNRGRERGRGGFVCRATKSQRNQCAGWKPEAEARLDSRLLMSF